MNAVTEYLQPLAIWIYNHPHLALFFTFIVSLSESLAFIGSIIPGTVTMTAIGILAGSGAMRIDLTLIAGIIGAIFGDGISYSIGRIFKNQITLIWPFRKYPNWIKYGHEYFARHGGKSVLIGRFTGPLRALIPIIAGMMGMNRLHFFVANVISAIGWSILYIVPGILIGTASNELSPNVASKLFLVLLALLTFILILSYLIKWLFINIRQWLHGNLNRYWELLLHSRISTIFQMVTPEDERGHQRTAGLFFSFCILLSLFFILFLIVTNHTWFTTLNQSIHQFCLSIRTNDFDTFFIIERLCISVLPLIIFVYFTLSFAIYYSNWRLSLYWLSLSMVTYVLALIMTPWISSPEQYLHTILGNSFTQNMIAAATFSFLIFYINRFFQNAIGFFIKSILMVTLFFSSISIIYLGEDWILNIILSLVTGFTISLLFWICFRCKQEPSSNMTYLFITPITLMLIATVFSSYLLFYPLSDKFQPYIKQYVIHRDAWWNQSNPILPLYSKNRFGKPIGLMNIQFSGSIIHFREQLEKNGWQSRYDTFISSLLSRLNKHNKSVTLPFTAQFYMNKKPKLLMSFNKTNDNQGIVLRLWRSNFHIYNSGHVIWIGSIYQTTQQNGMNQIPIDTLIKQIKGYETRKVNINFGTKNLPNASPPVLWLIKES